MVDKSDDEKKYDLCMIGRLYEQKNPLRFIKIVNEVKKQIPNIKAEIIGNGILMDDCLNLIKELDLEDNIVMQGFYENPFNLLNKAKIFVLTSSWEGFGLVAYEAISLKIPAVVSNVGGLPDIINEDCGFLCNNDEEFIANIVRLLKDKKLYKKLSNGALSKAKKMDNLNEYIDKIDSIYKEIL
jgi:glycosyltransferase involved in cell wall biosynthesis